MKATKKRVRVMHDVPSRAKEGERGTLMELDNYWRLNVIPPENCVVRMDDCRLTEIPRASLEHVREGSH